MSFPTIFETGDYRMLRVYTHILLNLRVFDFLDLISFPDLFD